MSPHAAFPQAEASGDPPRGDTAGFVRFLVPDATAGFLVFLIALPLCLGIAIASGFPPVAGVFTAVIGAVVTSLISNSELTIKGPAAGLIVIVLAAMHSFGFTAGGDPVADQQAYRMTLAVGCVAGLVQLGLGLLRVGVFGDFFPKAVVHGMLAAIGLTILLKQLPVVFGNPPGGEPLEVLQHLPAKMRELNPQITLIGLVSLAILFLFPFVLRRLRPPWLRFVPPQLLVLAVAVPLGGWFALTQEHTYSFLGRDYQVGEWYLVPVPRSLAAAITLPDFSVFTSSATAWSAAWWVLLFAAVGSIESLLSTKAIDSVDPWRRKTDLNRDLLAVGVANVAAAAVGGLPMVSEIVRSKANIDAGGRTRFADFWHGFFLLAFVALLPWAIHRIPLSALAAMLVYTGYRLASPREFINVFRIGSDQLAIFVITIIAVLATDLLVGVLIGIIANFGFHAFNGVPLESFFKPFLEVSKIDDQTVQVDAGRSAVFSNWIPFRRRIEQLGLEQGNDVIVNLAGTHLVDHHVMVQFEKLARDFEQVGRRLNVIGLEAHRSVSDHPHATRRRVMTRIR
ncbi:MAG: SulP family inorganic anion transporter [Planctomycetota bacterium]|nr:SulP family inorganic anion transporter [Planctomycetota bacterium]